jgi:hypothetical protein
LLWAGGATAVAAIWLVRRRVRSRRAALARLAKRLNLNYAPQDRLDLPARYRRLTLLGRGHERRTADVISGTTARGAVSGFRHEYDVGFGAERETRRWAVAVVEVHRDWPRFVVLPGASNGCPSGRWVDAVPDGVPKQSAFGGPGRCLYCAEQDAVRWQDRTGWEWLAEIDAPCGLEVTDGLVAAYSTGSPILADTYEWLLRIVDDAAEQLERTLGAGGLRGDGAQTVDKETA